MTNSHSDLDFISSVSSNFADALNKAADHCEFSGQDAYEVLTLAFGDDFSERDLRAAMPKSYDALAEAISTELEFAEVTPIIARNALEYALHCWSGDGL